MVSGINGINQKFQTIHESKMLSDFHHPIEVIIICDLH